jgi:hypothetical protein
MISIGENIKKLPKKDLKKWVSSQGHRDSKDWKDVLAELKETLNVPGTSSKSKEN